ncbi:MAG: AAA family ATPase [Pirellulales bacterium]
MTLSERLAEYVRACFTGLWIESHEHEDALAEMARMCRQENWRLATWDIERGLQVAGQGAGQDAPAAGNAGGQDPLAAIRSVNALATQDGSAILVLANFHRFLQSAEIVQALAHQITAGKQNRTFVVILSPVVQIPTELEKQFVIIEHDLPGREQLAQLARNIATEEGELPEDVGLEMLLDAAAGLTRYEAEGAFSLSLVRQGRITPEAVWELKTGMLKKSGLLSLHRGQERFGGLGGLDALKSFCTRAMRRKASAQAKPAKPRGVLLLGVPGTGKSAFCKALGNETGRPTLVMDVGAMMGSLVGSTEANIRQALKIADAMAPAVVMIDEVEKALSGVAASGQTDSGVSARLFGTFLSWLNDHESDVFTVCTCNDISKLPPEFSRAERFDGIFFLDLPGVQEKRAIWRLYLERFGLDPSQPKPVDADWTGAEIRSCCRLAALLDVPLVEAAQNVVPVATTAAESVSRLRDWASGRCLAADTPGIYTRGGKAFQKTPRRIHRDPSNN